MQSRYDMSYITFNGEKYCHFELTESSKEHYGPNSERYYRYIIGHLDNQKWVSTEVGRDGTPEFITASVTSAIKPSYADSDYRETWFRTCPDRETIIFFHGCSIRKEQYEKAHYKMNIQFEHHDE